MNISTYLTGNDIIAGRGKGTATVKLSVNNTGVTAYTDDTTLNVSWDSSTQYLTISFPSVDKDISSDISLLTDGGSLTYVRLHRRTMPFTNNVCLPANVNIRTSGKFTRMLIFRGDITGTTVKIYNNSWRTPAYAAYILYDNGVEEHTYEVSSLLTGIYGAGQYRANHQSIETVFDVINPYQTAFLEPVSITGGAYESYGAYYIPIATSDSDKSVITLQAVDKPDFSGETTNLTGIYYPSFQLYNYVYPDDLEGWNYWRSNTDVMTVGVVNNNLRLTVYGGRLSKTFSTPIFVQDGLATVQSRDYYSDQVITIVKVGVLTVDIPDEVEEETDTPISVTYATGRNLTFNTPDDVIITIDEETDNGDGTTTATGTIRVNEENTAGQITISISDGTDTITRTINILEKEPPMAAPTISINQYADLSFPQEGGIKYITITYGNSSTEFINTPYSTVLGTTITAQSTTEIDNGVEIYYAVSVPSTTYERDIPLIFSCSNAAGLSCTETFTGMQEGETSETEYCNITAVPSGLSFPASGGTQRVTVTAAYPDVDNPIKVVVRHATMGITISWCTAVFVSRTYDDDYSSVTEEWDITMNPNEVSEPSSAAVTFSYTNSPTYGGDSASVTVIATQDAADSGLPESSLTLYRTIMRFDANGVFDYSDATCTADYRWTNEEDIEEPVISDDWVVLTEGTHQTGAGYIKIPWGVAVARNTSTSDRTATVIFRSIGQDNVEHQAVLTVTQYGVEGKDETLEYVDLLWKDCEVVLGDDDVTFEILDERYNRFYTGRCQKRPNGENNTFLINKIIQDYVWMEEIPSLLNGTSEYQEHPNGYRKFMLDTPDTVGAMKSYFFKYDWSYQEGSPFVLSESIVPYVVEGQKNLITYCNLDYSNPQTDVYTWVKKDGTTENGGISAENEEYATRVVSMPANADSYFLSGQRYEVISPCQSRYVLYYLSPKGGWCWFPIMGKVNSSDRLTSFTLTKNYDNTTAQFGKTRYTVDISTDYELSTGFLTQAQSLRMWEMLESNMVYMHDLEKDVIFPVVMKSDTVEKKRYQRGQTKMLSYTFGVETSQGRMRI